MEVDVHCLSFNVEHVAGGEREFIAHDDRTQEASVRGTNVEEKEDGATSPSKQPQGTKVVEEVVDATATKLPNQRQARKAQPIPANRMPKTLELKQHKNKERINLGHLHNTPPQKCKE